MTVLRDEPRGVANGKAVLLSELRGAPDAAIGIRLSSLP